MLSLPEFTDKPQLSKQELAVRDLNRHVDREPAIKGQKTPSKLVITLKQPGGKGDRIRTFPKYNHGMDLDWGLSEHIRAVNRWRSQVLRLVSFPRYPLLKSLLKVDHSRMLGQARPARVGFHSEEVQWLIDYHQQYERDSFARDGNVNFSRIDWHDVTRAFNAKFAGHILGGSTIPRPSRTKASLTTERYRIKAICELVGLTLRSPRG